MTGVEEIFPSLETSLLLFLSIIILIYFLDTKWNLLHSKPKKNSPPSPPKLPIIGNFHQLGSCPNHSLQALSKKHGPIMLLHLGNIPTLVVSSAEAAREILKTHDLWFSSRPNLPIPNILLYGCKDIAFSPYGEHWRQLKSMVVIHLLSNTRVKSFKHVREKEIGRIIGLLEESCGCIVDMSSLLVSLTNNVICSVTVGKTYDGSKLIDMLGRYVNMLNVFTVGSYFKWLSWVDWLRGLERQARKMAKELDDFFEDVVEEHAKKKRLVEGESVETQDLVDILLDVQRDNTIGFTLERDALKAIILVKPVTVSDLHHRPSLNVSLDGFKLVTFGARYALPIDHQNMFAAGTDTIFGTLHWTMSEIIKHPRVMKKLQEEVTEIAKGRSSILEEDLEKLVYLKAVVKESLRLHGPFPLLLPHKSTQYVKLNGYDIPEGTQVIINSWAIGRDPSLWEEPEDFIPERFLNSKIEYHGHNFEFTPFGAGRRRCPAIQFSAVIMELVLANIVYKFDLALPNGVKVEDLDMSERIGIALHRKSPLKVMASRRF